MGSPGAPNWAFGRDITRNNTNNHDVCTVYTVRVYIYIYTYTHTLHMYIHSGMLAVRIFWIKFLSSLVLRWR